nr:cytochrome P450 [Candidatus Mycobacterium methanotrophicum]
MTSASSVAEPQALLLQLMDPANRADPYAVYSRFRADGPVRLPESNLTVFSGYRDCDEALRHPSSSVDRSKSTVVQRLFADAANARPPWPPMFLFLDPPDHTRLRKLVSKAFVPKVVSELQPEIAGLVDGLLDAIAQRGRFDAVSDLAYPLPVAVICWLLGVPLRDEPEFGRASELMAQALDPFLAITGEPSQGMQERLRASQWLRDYLHDLIGQRRSRPGDDLMSRLIAVEESGDQLAEDEIVSICSLLLVAGHETTVNLIANAMLAMLRRPAQWAALGADVSALGIRAGSALLPGRSAGSVGGCGRVVGSHGTLPASTPGRSTGLPAECHAARIVGTGRDRVNPRRMGSYCTLFASSRVIAARSTRQKSAAVPRRRFVHLLVVLRQVALDPVDVGLG